MAVLGLLCCTQAFFSVVSKGYSLVAEHWLSSCGSLTWLLHGMWDLPGPGIEPMSPYTGRQILNHWMTREVPHQTLLPSAHI